MFNSKNWFENILRKFRHLDANISPHPQKPDDFVNYVFGEMRNLLKKQVYKKKTGEVISPPKVIIFLSVNDDKEWRGAKRQALIEDLENIALENALEIGANPDLPTTSVKVELQVDMMLKYGTVRCESQWEEDGEKQVNAVFNEFSMINEMLPQEKELTETFVIEEKTRITNREDKEKTIPISAIPQQFFLLEVWLMGEKQKEYEFFQNRIIIGRDSETKGKVDLNLGGDSRIGRHHATLEIDKDGNFWITAIGGNPLKVDDYLVPQNKTVPVKISQEIQILDFTLILKK